MPVDTFLKDYWQKQPVVLRNVFPDIDSLLSTDELAGLALEEDVASPINYRIAPANQPIAPLHSLQLASDARASRRGSFCGIA